MCSGAWEGQHQMRTRRGHQGAALRQWRGHVVHKAVIRGGNEHENLVTMRKKSYKQGVPTLPMELRLAFRRYTALACNNVQPT